jgi:hypothetical protein
MFLDKAKTSKIKKTIALLVHPLKVVRVSFVAETKA